MLFAENLRNKIGNAFFKACVIIFEADFFFRLCIEEQNRKRARVETRAAIFPWEKDYLWVSSISKWLQEAWFLQRSRMCEHAMGPVFPPSVPDSHRRARRRRGSRVPERVSPWRGRPAGRGNRRTSSNGITGRRNAGPFLLGKSQAQAAFPR